MKLLLVLLAFVVLLSSVVAMPPPAPQQAVGSAAVVGALGLLAVIGVGVRRTYRGSTGLHRPDAEDILDPSIDFPLDSSLEPARYIFALEPEQVLSPTETYLSETYGASEVSPTMRSIDALPPLSSCSLIVDTDLSQPLDVSDIPGEKSRTVGWKEKLYNTWLLLCDSLGAIRAQLNHAFIIFKHPRMKATCQLIGLVIRHFVPLMGLISLVTYICRRALPCVWPRLLWLGQELAVHSQRATVYLGASVISLGTLVEENGERLVKKVLHDLFLMATFAFCVFGERLMIATTNFWFNYAIQYDEHKNRHRRYISPEFYREIEGSLVTSSNGFDTAHIALEKAKSLKEQLNDIRLSVGGMSTSLRNLSNQQSEMIATGKASQEHYKAAQKAYNDAAYHHETRDNNQMKAIMDGVKDFVIGERFRDLDRRLDAFENSLKLLDDRPRHEDEDFKRIRQAEDRLTKAADYEDLKSVQDDILNLTTGLNALPTSDVTNDLRQDVTKVTGLVSARPTKEDLTGLQQTVTGLQGDLKGFVKIEDFNQVCADYNNLRKNHQRLLFVVELITQGMNPQFNLAFHATMAGQDPNQAFQMFVQNMNQPASTGSMQGPPKSSESSTTAKPQPALPSTSAPAPVTPFPDSTKAQPAATKAQPAATKAQPAATKAQPAATKAQPAATKAQPDATKAESVKNEAQPAANKVQPATTKTQPAAARFQPPATKVEAAATKVQTAAPKAQNAPGKAQSIASKAQSVASKAQTAASEVQPATRAFKSVAQGPQQNKTAAPSLKPSVTPAEEPAASTAVKQPATPTPHANIKAPELAKQQMQDYRSQSNVPPRTSEAESPPQTAEENTSNVSLQTSKAAPAAQSAEKSVSNIISNDKTALTTPSTISVAHKQAAIRLFEQDFPGSKLNLETDPLTSHKNSWLFAFVYSFGSKFIFDNVHLDDLKKVLASDSCTAELRNHGLSPKTDDYSKQAEILKIVVNHWARETNEQDPIHIGYIVQSSGPRSPVCLFDTTVVETQDPGKYRIVWLHYNDAKDASPNARKDAVSVRKGDSTRLKNRWSGINVPEVDLGDDEFKNKVGSVPVMSEPEKQPPSEHNGPEPGSEKQNPQTQTSPQLPAKKSNGSQRSTKSETTQPVRRSQNSTAKADELPVKEVPPQPLQQLQPNIQSPSHEVAPTTSANVGSAQQKQMALASQQDTEHATSSSDLPIVMYMLDQEDSFKDAFPKTPVCIENTRLDKKNALKAVIDSLSHQHTRLRRPTLDELTDLSQGLGQHVDAFTPEMLCQLLVKVYTSLDPPSNMFLGSWRHNGSKEEDYTIYQPVNFEGTGKILWVREDNTTGVTTQWFGLRRPTAEAKTRKRMIKLRMTEPAPADDSTTTTNLATTSAAIISAPDESAQASKMSDKVESTSTESKTSNPVPTSTQPVTGNVVPKVEPPKVDIAQATASSPADVASIAASTEPQSQQQSLAKTSIGPSCLDLAGQNAFAKSVVNASDPPERDSIKKLLPPTVFLAPAELPTSTATSNDETMTEAPPAEPATVKVTPPVNAAAPQGGSQDGGTFGSNFSSSAFSFAEQIPFKTETAPPSAPIKEELMTEAPAATIPTPPGSPELRNQHQVPAPFSSSFVLSAFPFCGPNPSKLANDSTTQPVNDKDMIDAAVSHTPFVQTPIDPRLSPATGQNLGTANSRFDYNDPSKLNSSRTDPSYGPQTASAQSGDQSVGYRYHGVDSSTTGNFNVTNEDVANGQQAQPTQDEDQHRAVLNTKFFLSGLNHVLAWNDAHPDPPSAEEPERYLKRRVADFGAMPGDEISDASLIEDDGGSERRKIVPKRPSSIRQRLQREAAAQGKSCTSQKLAIPAPVPSSEIASSQQPKVPMSPDLEGEQFLKYEPDPADTGRLLAEGRDSPPSPAAASEESEADDNDTTIFQYIQGHSAYYTKLYPSNSTPQLYQAWKQPPEYPHVGLDYKLPTNSPPFTYPNPDTPKPANMPPHTHPYPNTQLYSAVPLAPAASDKSTPSRASSISSGFVDNEDPATFNAYDSAEGPAQMGYGPRQGASDLVHQELFQERQSDATNGQILPDYFYRAILLEKFESEGDISDVEQNQ